MAWIQHIPKDVQKLYEIHDYHHAAAILAAEFQTNIDIGGCCGCFSIAILL
jgi:hypothetical protein